MSSKETEEMSIATLFHGLLFAYQKATKEMLGSGWEAFVHPTLEILARIDERSGSRLVRAKSLEEAMGSFSDMLLRLKAVKKICFEKIGKDKYLLKIDGCAWAKHVHEELKPKDVTCPLALVVMAIYKRYTGNKVEETESKYFAEGTETVIRPFPTLESDRPEPIQTVVGEPQTPCKEQE